MAGLGQDIGVCLFMVRLNHVCGLKFKWTSNWNCMKTNQNIIWKCYQTKPTFLKTVIKLKWT